ncbi:GGDEF domain-containing protein [Pseudoalteromonas luteoviolacea]|uniref:diguanylate cyclase n=1 Tax=Pseudoalteromonas luteoviolacea H33 TaxID=1365251 RepID=A0A167G857_9GAMM|nr:GGDEF domain-containing protein [Pseudoalteromonas luteoviolacea]KZN54220.1 hypothetical protein N476_08475 [Pseudoalteromonas luteoviolacea H33]KZN78249.1 hypothetical protein N477_09050 [Pseudoalteromonas luteoviolacea H33-S]MBQ4877497.1 GGDEF domain-containing protein [Pseudoalteromonas luteoviolacea]MBQ4906404.1 GGDEF domain-containing protein [Pseudoalteromonas luteoviolacea]
MPVKSNSQYSLRLNTYFDGKGRVFPLLSLIILAVFTPLAIKNLIIGEYALGALIMIFVCAFIADANALIKGRALPIHEHIIATLAISCIALSLFTLGAGTIFWVFPVSIIISFAFPLATSILFNCALLLTATTYVFLNYDMADALRFFFAYLLTACSVHLLLKHIDALHTLLKEESSKDALTGALNRRQLNLFLKDALANKVHYHYDSTLIMIDVDHFKQINDVYGHAKGDEVLVNLVSDIREQIRETDLLFRVGGEEFVVLLPNTDLKTAQKVAQKLRANIKSLALLDNKTITVSLGLCASADDLTQTKWMNCADKALYAAKQRGRDRVCQYNLHHNRIEDVAA